MIRGNNDRNQNPDDTAKHTNQNGFDDKLHQNGPPLWHQWPSGYRFRGYAPLTDTNMMFITPIPPDKQARAR